MGNARFLGQYVMMIVGMVAAGMLLCGAEPVQAAGFLNSCTTYCHGMPPRDAARKANFCLSCRQYTCSDCWNTVEGRCLSCAPTPESMVAAAAASFQTIDVVISNAGYAVGNSCMDFKLEDWDRNFAVHTRGAWLLAKASYPYLKASQGNMVITASISGSHATPALGAYSPSKAATLMFAKQLAVEWGPDGIRVNAISPGLVHTNGSDVVFSDPEVKALRASKIPLRRVADPEDIAKVVSFMVGPDAAYLSGADVVVDGGLVNTLMPNLGMSNNWTGKVTG